MLSHFIIFLLANFLIPSPLKIKYNLNQHMNYKYVKMVTSIYLLNILYFSQNLHTQIAVPLVTSAASAAASIVYLAHNGNSDANWGAICQQFNDFCRRVSGAVVASYVTAILFIVLVIVSAVALKRKWGEIVWLLLFDMLCFFDFLWIRMEMCDNLKNWKVWKIKNFIETCSTQFLYTSSAPLTVPTEK